MVRRIVERSFDHKKPVVVRRAFSAAGRTFQEGSDFPWQILSIAVRRVRQMFDSGMLIHPGEYADNTDDTNDVQSTDTGSAPPPAPPVDNSDLEVDSLVVLQAIAQREGAQLKTTKSAQRQAIIDKRSE